MVHRPLRTALAVSTLLAVACVGTLAVSPTDAEAAPAAQSFARSTLDGIRIDLHAAQLLMSHTSSDEVSVALTEIEVSDSCRIRVEPVGRTLVVEATLQGGHGRCEVDVRMAVPAGLPVSADVGAGDITVGDLATRLDLNLGAGNVSGSVKGSAVQVSSGAGNISLHGLSAAASASTGTGNVSLRFAHAPAGVIEVSSGVGNVEVHLPVDTAADTSATTGLGKVEQGLTHQPGAPTVVRASTGLGNVQVDDA